MQFEICQKFQQYFEPIKQNLHASIEKAQGRNTTRVSVCSQTQYPLYKSLTQTRKIATIAIMQKSCGSLQVCARGFRVCKTKQTYVTLSYTLVSNYVPKKQVSCDKKIHTNVKIQEYGLSKLPHYQLNHHHDGQSILATNLN